MLHEESCRMEYEPLLFRWGDEVWSSQTEIDKKVKGMVYTWLHKNNADGEYEDKTLC